MTGTLSPARHGAEQSLLDAGRSNEVDARRQHPDDRRTFEAQHAHERRQHPQATATAAAATAVAAILEFAGPTLTFNIHGGSLRLR